MLTIPTLRRLLEPYGLRLNAAQEECLLTYLELLMRWNQRVNLIAPTSWEDCVTRHFGESLYVSRWVDLQGRLLDIGSGAGFPGLALKIVSPNLAVTLLEPVAKKRAFLKEVVRACEFDSVDVRGDRLADYAGSTKSLQTSDFAIARAVGKLRDLVAYAGSILRRGGALCLWLGHDQSADLLASGDDFEWQEPIRIPLSLRREIWIGRLRQT